MQIYSHMNREYFEKVFSTKRMSKFLDAHSQDERKAIPHYQANIELCESFYPLISVLEVAHRNSINRELITNYKIDDWNVHFAITPGLKTLNRNIPNAQA